MLRYKKLDNLTSLSFASEFSHWMRFSGTESKAHFAATLIEYVLGSFIRF